MPRVTLTALLSLLCACSYTFDEEAPEIPLLGEPPAASALPRLNRAAAESARVVRGVDGAPWLAVRELGGVLRLVRLADPPAEEELQARQVHLFYRHLYLLDPSNASQRPSLLRVRSAGEAGPGREFRLPYGDPLLVVAGTEDVFVYWPRRPDTKEFLIVRSDGYSRAVPVPQGVDPGNPLGEGLLFFDGPGRYLFVRDGRGQLRAYSTLSEQDADLGERPRNLLVLDGLRALLACGEDGLVRVPMDGAPATVLDPRPCTPDGLRTVDRAAYYLSGGTLWRTPLDGGTPPEPALPQGAQQLLAAGPEGLLAYSTDPPRRWASGASDGWIGGWRFMERGRQVAFSADGRRVRWLENAATLSGAGDLLSAEMGGEALRLARNTRQFHELPDGRLLCVANYAFRGAQNRIVAVDERARTARWVADGASGFLLIPGTRDLLAYLVKDNRGFDIVRLAIPPR